MSFSSKQTAIETYFKNQWGSTTQIEYENDAWNPDLYDEYVRFSIQFGDAVAMELGNKAFRYFGVVFVQIFVRPAVGNARMLTLADTASGLFRTTLSVTGVKFLVPRITKFPNSAGGWVQTQLACNFYFEEILP